jgi:site-specific recombinase XerD
LPAEVLKDLEYAASHSLAKKTWNSYKTAERMLATYCSEKKLRYILPATEEVMLGFIHWLAFKRKLSAGTISSYIAGVSKLHILKGMPEPKLRTELVKMILKGKKNMEAADKLKHSDSDTQRKPVTPDILLLIKNRLSQWETNEADKLTVWTVSSLLFHGAFRGGEILSKSVSTFDPAFTLLRKDIRLVQDSQDRLKSSIQVRVKAPKEDKNSKTTIVDIFESDTSICPVKAFKKWQRATSTNQANQPAFRLNDGTPLTAKKFNHILKDRLKGFLDDQNITSHSFRSGTASMMATLGYSDSDVKSVGRWSSRAFEDYIKLPRTKRINIAKNMIKHGFPNK